MSITKTQRETVYQWDELERSIRGIESLIHDIQNSENENMDKRTAIRKLLGPTLIITILEEEKQRLVNEQKTLSVVE